MPEKPCGAARRVAQLLGELPIAFRGDGGEQMVLVAEMAVGRGGGNADPPRRFAQADRAGAVGVQQVARGGDQRRAEIAVVIGRAQWRCS